MKYYIQSFFSIVSLCLILFLTSITNKMHAQISNTSYFLRSSIYRHQLNPAYDAPKDYFALPIMGNISIGTSGNFGLNHFLYDAPTISAYETTTFMSHLLMQISFFLISKGILALEQILMFNCWL